MPGLAYRRVVLLEGDEQLIVPILSKIKREWFPKGASPSDWVEFVLPEKRQKDKESNKEADDKEAEESKGYTPEEIAAELSIFNWEITQRVLVLRGVPDRKEMRDALQHIIPQIPEPHTLVIWDRKGCMVGSDWNALRNEIKGYGQVVQAAAPLSDDAYSDHDRFKYVTEAAAKSGQKITPENASLLLSMLGPDRGLIDTEITKLALMSDGDITTELIRSTVLPVAHDYPVYFFYAAFNTGKFSTIMDSAERLLNNGFEYNGLITLAMKQARWQVAAAYLLWQGRELRNGLKKLGTSKDEATVAKAIYKKCSLRMREQTEKNLIVKSNSGKSKVFKQELLNSEINIRDIIELVRDRLPKLCPPEVKDVNAWIYQASIDRYQCLHNAMFEIRRSNEDVAQSLFNNAMRTISLS